jgi:hypothetical protein
MREAVADVPLEAIRAIFPRGQIFAILLGSSAEKKDAIFLVKLGFPKVDFSRVSARLGNAHAAPLNEWTALDNQSIDG